MKVTKTVFVALLAIFSGVLATYIVTVNLRGIPERVFVYIPGALQKLDEDYLYIENLEGREIRVNIKESGSPFWCVRMSDGRSECNFRNWNTIPSGTKVCASAYIKDGRFVAGKVFFNALCSLIANTEP